MISVLLVTKYLMGQIKNIFVRKKNSKAIFGIQFICISINCKNSIITCPLLAKKSCGSKEDICNLQRFTYANKDGIIALSTINMLRNDFSNEIPLNYVINIYIEMEIIRVVVDNDGNTLPTCLIIQFLWWVLF